MIAKESNAQAKLDAFILKWKPSKEIKKIINTSDTSDTSSV
jgi:hypothetical protein